MGAVMRVDLSDAVADESDRLARVVAGAAARRRDRGDRRRRGGAVPDVQRGLPAAVPRHWPPRCVERGIELWAVHVVDHVQAGGRWHCVDGCGSHGSVEDPAVSPLAVAAVVDGRRLYAQPRRPADGHRHRGPEPRGGAGRGDQRPWTAGQCRALRRSRRLHPTRRAGGDRRGQPGRRRWRSSSDAELAELGYALTDLTARDTLYALAVGRDAGRPRRCGPCWPAASRCRGGSKRLCCLHFRPMPAVTARWRAFRSTRRSAATPSTGWRECSTPRCSRACVPNRSGSWR